MAQNTAAVRLKSDYKEIIQDPLPNIRACPSPNNLQLWYYIFVGEKDTPFEGGYYFGTIKFAKEYPFKPPSYSMLMENGRFIVGKDICITNSAYHAESWNPLWTVSGILTGFIAFFHDVNQLGFIGSVSGQTTANYKRFAIQSKKCVLDTAIVCELFPDVVEQIKAEMNGAPPQHSLPFPPEHFIHKKRTEVNTRTVETEIKQYESELQYDSYHEEEETDEEIEEAA